MDRHNGCELDLHRLDLRFAATRLAEPQAVARLAHSLEHCGQLVPCIVVRHPQPVAGEEGQLVLIDGYRRVAALRQLGCDTVHVEHWVCDLTTALLAVLTQAQNRAFAAIEQALLLRELLAERELSQHELARRCGHDVSWVNRRLQLLQALSDTALAAVRAGQLSTWAASRVLVPLSRANAGHAERLLRALARQPLTTRELRRWFEHYQPANHTTRERMVDHPALFVQAIQATQAQQAGERLRDGPEGACAADLRRLEALIQRLRQHLPEFRRQLIDALPRLQAALDALRQTINRSATDDQIRDPGQRAHAASARS